MQLVGRVNTNHDYVDHHHNDVIQKLHNDVIPEHHDYDYKEDALDRINERMVRAPESVNHLVDEMNLEHEVEQPVNLLKRSRLHADAHVDHFSQHWVQFLMMSTVGAAVIIVLLAYVIVRRMKRKSTPLTPFDDIERSDGHKSRKLSCAVPKTPLPLNLSSTAQQPPLGDLPHGILGVAGSGGHEQQPIRIKARGLLERRGSSASLTLDLSGDQSFSYNSPHGECSVEDYLSSAGNRLTRRQLRASLKHSSVLHQEFLDIPLNHPAKPMDLPGCNHKNRYKSIWPNERSRIVLQRASSDPIDRYINANYIRGYDEEPMAFIATQGPLANTVDDFWHMVWQEKVPCIVMMTRLNEKNKQKCEPYLPAKSAQYGPVTVTVRNTLPRNGYDVRTLLIENNGESREVKHFWFMGWPDQQAAPSSAARQLLQLAADVQNQRAKCRQKQGITEAGPILVHCSAGLGRTGCLIAICIGCRQLQEENMTDVLGIVCQMRLDRGGMIQTPEQYEFVHHALSAYEQQLCDSPTTAAMPLTSSSGSNSKNTSPDS